MVYCLEIGHYHILHSPFKFPECKYPHIYFHIKGVQKVIQHFEISCDSPILGKVRNVEVFKLQNRSGGAGKLPTQAAFFLMWVHRQGVSAVPFKFMH